MPAIVTLITPPSPFLLDQRVFVSLGILRVGAALEEAGIEVQHLDLNSDAMYEDRVARHFSSQQDARFAGITVTTPQLPSVARIVARIRSVSPGTRVILGGPHITLTLAAVKSEKRRGAEGRAHQAMRKLLELCDVAVAGDGELAILRALAPEAKGIIDADDPASGLFMTHEIYDRSPLPARHLVDLGTYRYEIEGHPSTSLIGQLGCPFACGFCGGRFAKSLRRIRTRSVASIIGEIRSLHESHGYTGFMFYDDELNVNPKLLKLLEALSELQISLGTELTFRGFVKSELFNLKQARAMRAAGFRWLLCGFESGSDRVLANINKKATRADNDRAMEHAATAGIKVKALMSIGHPGESEETVGETVNWLMSSRPDDFDCSVITLYPGSPYYDESTLTNSELGVWTYTAPNSGDRLHSFDVDFTTTEDYYKGDPNGGYRSFVFTDYLDRSRIVELRDGLERSVRQSLGIPFPTGLPSLLYEHSMGQRPSRPQNFVI